METMTGHLLDYVHHHNQQTLPALPDSIEVFSLTETIKLPEDENGKRLGMVHKHVEDNDFKAIQPGEPIIQLFDGGEITWDGDYVAYPHFINEAAYYDNNVALSMAVKRTIKVD
jgi:aspartoacylase